MSALTPEQEQQAAERLDALKARGARDQHAVSKLFMTEAECALRSRAHAEASRAGVVNHHAVKRHADAIVGSLAPVIAETHLTGAEALELRAAQVRAPLSAEAATARHDQFIEDMRTPIYGTKHVIETKAEAVRAAAHRSPALRKALNTGDAANSVTLGRGFYRRVEDGNTIVRTGVTTPTRIAIAAPKAIIG
jgi:hypothetical protein